MDVALRAERIRSSGVRILDTQTGKLVLRLLLSKSGNTQVSADPAPVFHSTSLACGSLCPANLLPQLAKYQRCGHCPLFNHGIEGLQRPINILVRMCGRQHIHLAVERRDTTLQQMQA